MVRSFRSALYLSVSAAALVAGALAGSGTASAQSVEECVPAGGMSTLIINCTASTFDQTLTFDPTTVPNTITLAPSSIGTIPFDLSSFESIDFTGGATNVGVAVTVQTVTGEATFENRISSGPLDNRVTINGASVIGTIDGGLGDDTLEALNTTDGETNLAAPLGPSFDGGPGNDMINIGSIDVLDGPLDVGAVTGNIGNDIVSIRGGFTESADGGDGTDRLDFLGGEIGGPITRFETVEVNETGSPAEIGGIIDIDGVADASGSNVTVRDSDLLAGERTPAFDVSDIDDFTADNSTITFGTALGETGLNGEIVQGINTLHLINGSRLFVDGNVNLLGGGRRGGLIVRNSVVDMVDGATDDSLTFSAVQFDNATVRIDVDPTLSAQSADRLLVDNDPENPVLEDSVTGDNRLQVDFTVQPEDRLDVPVVEIFGESEAAFLQSALETFSVEAIGESFDPMRDLVLVADEDGTVRLRDIERETVSVPNNASNAASASQGADGVEDVNTELADEATGFGAGQQRTQISPTFGVFSNGEFGRRYHDGYSVTGGGASGVTPAFTTDSFSIIGTGELDASAEFGLEDIGVRVSAFGGYTQSYVELDRTADGIVFTDFTATGFNESAIFGTSVLVSKIAGAGNLNYGLASAAGLLGETETRSGDTGARGRYDTQGLILSAKAGRNIAVSDNVRLDVRFGGAFVHFHGDKVILLLGGYDKGRSPKPKRQQREIERARKLLAQFKGRRRRNR